MYRQNWLFEIDQKKLNKELSEVIDFNNETAIEEESKQLWVDIWNRRMGGVQDCYIKMLNSMQERTGRQLNEILNRRNPLPAWMTNGQSFL